MGNHQDLSQNSEPQPIVQTSSTFGFHPSRAELYQMGKSLREKCPRSSHAAWQPAADRPDPIVLMQESSKGRIQKLVPIRYGRMMQTPFTFYRGAALNMAADLAVTPSSGLRVQACGDAPLLNFGAFATPERRVIFDINDLDETLSAPWEWDVKRLAASYVLASRNNRFTEDTARDTALTCVRSYREHMTEYAAMRAIDVWYSTIDLEKMIPLIKDEVARTRAQRMLTKARERNILEHEFPELVTTAGMAPQIKENPPLIYHWREQGQDEFSANVQQAFACYRESLEEDSSVLVDRYKLMDIAIKVVGVGSVGTWCAVGLMMADELDPLFLQVKEARAPVLEGFAGKSAFIK